MAKTKNTEKQVVNCTCFDISVKSYCIVKDIVGTKLNPQFRVQYFNSLTYHIRDGKYLYPFAPTLSTEEGLAVCYNTNSLHPEEYYCPAEAQYLDEVVKRNNDLSFDVLLGSNPHFNIPRSTLFHLAYNSIRDAFRLKYCTEYMPTEDEMRWLEDYLSHDISESKIKSIISKITEDMDSYLTFLYEEILCRDCEKILLGADLIEVMSERDSAPIYEAIKNAGAYVSLHVYANDRGEIDDWRNRLFIPDLRKKYFVKREVRITHKETSYVEVYAGSDEEAISQVKLMDDETISSYTIRREQSVNYSAILP